MTRGWADGRGDHDSPSHPRLITILLGLIAPLGSPVKTPQETSIWDNSSDRPADGSGETSDDYGLRREAPSICPREQVCAVARLALSLERASTGGGEGVVALFSRISRYPWLKGSLLLHLGTGVLLPCVAWDTGMSACFHKSRICWAGPFGHDLTGGLRLLSRRSLAFFCYMIDLLLAGLGDRRWRHYRDIGRHRDELPCCIWDSVDTFFVLCTCAQSTRRC